MRNKKSGRDEYPSKESEDFDFDKGVARIHEELDRVFSRALENLRPIVSSGGKQLQKWSESRMPISNVYETESEVIATFELPGVDKDEIELNVTENTVEVNVTRKAEKEQKSKNGYAYESRAHSFYRKLPLPEDVDPDTTEAEYRNGVLKVRVDKLKKESKKSKKVAVK